MTGPENATASAARAAEEWRTAVLRQRWATPDHSDFYAFGGELVDGLMAVQNLANVLRGQVAGYADGRRLYDDTYEIEPALRLAEAADDLAQLGAALGTAIRAANRFWSSIGHIGEEVDR